MIILDTHPITTDKNKNSNRLPCSLWMEWSSTGVCSCSRRYTSGTFWQSEHHLPSCTPSKVSPATCTGSPGSQQLTSGSNVLFKRKHGEMSWVPPDTENKCFYLNKWQFAKKRKKKKAHRWFARQAGTESANHPSAPLDSWSTRCPQEKLPLTCGSNEEFKNENRLFQI